MADRKGPQAGTEALDGMKCADCGGVMELGFIPQWMTHPEPLETLWYPGRPQFTMSTFLRKPPSPRKYVSAWRCEDCGVLKFYALPKKWRPVTDWSGEHE